MKIVIATGTRADWGLLSPLAHELERRGADLIVAATNMHLREECGMTVHEIMADGFQPLCLPTPGDKAAVMSQVVSGFSELFAKYPPDCAVILGDRYEMLAVASAALLQGIPIVHIAGGAVSEGAFDDSIRHAITKMSTLHLVETDDYRRRVIQMGEEPGNVICTGAIGIHNILNTKLMTRDELEDSLKFQIAGGTLLITMHAATLSPLTPERQYANLLEALDTMPDRQLLFTYPNNDVDTAPLIAMLEEYARRREGVNIVPSLGRVRYLSALQFVDAVVGNSSSGIVEVPSMGIPVLDIGCRQDGRLRADAVVHCADDAQAIAEGLRRVTSKEMHDMAARRENPYAKPDTLQLMADAILNHKFNRYPAKKFYDIK